ncbi:MAG: hypothetical protein BalsKO_05390 [Balneolaceae bacterium]
MIRLIFFIGFFFAMSFASQVYAQIIPDSIAIDSVQVDSALVDSIKTQSLTKPKIEEKEPEQIIPWDQFRSFGYNSITNDSLLRWQIWPNWGEFYAYRNDVISFRQGTTGRFDAFQISGFNPYEQSLNLEGIDLTNPITGLVNYNYVPHHKIESLHEQKSDRYHSEIELKKYYILEPVSFLNYDEAKYGYRNLEFMVSQNFSERTNLELSFWDRRDGDNYPRNDVLGNQMVARGYHYLNQNVQIRSIYLRNQFENQEPFGYNVTNPLTFSFDRFSSGANEFGAESKTTRRDWITGIYFRADSNSVENTGLEITLTKDEFNLPFSEDTLNWDLRNYAVNAFKVFDVNSLSINVEANAGAHSFKENENILKSDWSDFSLASQINVHTIPNLDVVGRASLIQRSDGFTGTEIGAGAALFLNKKIRLKIDGSIFSRMPSIQELYWSSVNFLGNPDLENETGISLFGELEYNLSSFFKFGASGRIKQAKDDAFLGSDSTFVNSGDISSISGTVSGSFQNHRFEIESSATVDAFNDINPQASATPLDYNEQKIWIRNNAFIKGYAFDRATYVKLGIRTTFSPIPYGSKYFNTELQYWQANSSEIDIPAFFRLDAELSARVRTIMVVMRWENALDGVGQLGYFEAATFPMPARRLIVGIRAQFRN